MRNKELNMGLCIQGCGRSDVLYVLKGSERSVGEVSGPVEDAHSLVKWISNNFLTLLSDVHFSAYLLVVLAESYIALDNLKS